MKPKDLQLLDDYNTSFYKNQVGTVPTDIVTAALYKGRVFGLLLLALFIAFVLKFFDKNFLHREENFVKMFYLYFCIAITLRLVAYYELSRLLFGRLAFIIYYLTAYILCREHNDREIMGEKK